LDGQAPIRVGHFCQYGGILVKVHSFLKTTDFPESLGIAEDLNFRIMDIVQAAGTQFALPGKLIYMEEQEKS
jgi:hypothetical protein